MRWLFRAFSRHGPLTPEVRAAIDHWRDQPQPKESLGEIRFVVLDTETTGLNTDRDRLIAIGACAAIAGGICLSDSFNRVIRQTEASHHDNILVHGIGIDRQMDGDPLESVLTDFLSFAGRAPCVAWHAGFDARFLRRALQQRLGVRFDNVFLDAAAVARTLFRKISLPGSDFDAWTDHFGIRATTRHDALSDAFATAELWLVLLSEAERHGIRTLKALVGAERAQLDLERMGHDSR